MINQEACICKFITHYLYDSLSNTLTPLQGDQIFIMKNKETKVKTEGLTPHQQKRVDLAIDRLLFQPRYTLPDKVDRLKNNTSSR